MRHIATRTCVCILYQDPFKTPEQPPLKQDLEVAHAGQVVVTSIGIWHYHFQVLPVPALALEQWALVPLNAQGLIP